MTHIEPLEEDTEYENININYVLVALALLVGIMIGALAFN